MDRIAAGVVRFQTSVYPKKRELFDKLAEGQAPRALFVTCSDSRIETAMITQTDPGEMFVCRNAGNIVPPYAETASGVTASIEFAVAVLKVRHIVICGHTECGAMASLLDRKSLEHLPHVSQWLGEAQPAVDRVDASSPQCSADERIRRVTEENVLVQLENLATHASVRAAVEAKRIALHGWIYDIKTGDVSEYDEAKAAFVPIAEKYAEEIRALAARI
ncbi:MAG: carbonic anhydrase [Pseudomonadota bacterium]